MNKDELIKRIEKLILTEDSIYNYEDSLVKTRYGVVNIGRVKLKAKEMEGAYNAALEDVINLISEFSHSEKE